MQNAKKPRPLHGPRNLINVFRPSLFAALCTSVFLTCFVSPAQLTNNFPTQPISLADAVNLALTQNPNIRRAQKDLEASQGVVIQTRAIAVPKLRITGDYDAKQKSNVDVISTNGFNLGSDQNWDAQIRVVQSLYEGGRIASSLRVAKLTKEQAMLNYQTAVADTVLDVQVRYFDVLVAEQQIIVQEASVELLSRELEDTNRRFNAGTLPRFNVLRAEVELANAQPKLIRARNAFRIAKNNLANLLGFNIPKEALEDIPLKLSGRLEAIPYAMELQRAIALALEKRSELGALRKARSLRKEDIVNARATYKPSLQAYAGYEGRNSILQPDLNTDLHGWIAGVQLSWDIFDGGLAYGKIKQAHALHEKAEVDLEDAGRRIELEVRTAFSNFREADELLKSQEKVVEEGEEALRLAKARNEAGTATQLDVLSAQTALTEARTTQVQALHDYAVARARLERAVGATIMGK
jgi:outer membrane protein